MYVVPQCLSSLKDKYVFSKNVQNLLKHSTRFSTSFHQNLQSAKDKPQKTARASISKFSDEGLKRKRLEDCDVIDEEEEVSFHNASNVHSQRVSLFGKSSRQTLVFEIPGVTSKRESQVFETNMQVRQVELWEQTPVAPTEEKKYEEKEETEVMKESFVPEVFVDAS